MRITELLTESQLQQLEEGPKLDAFGRGVGKVVGGVAKGVGAVAGGIAGIGSAVKKGFQAGKSTVAGAKDAPTTSTTATTPQGAGGAKQPALTGGPTAGSPPAPSTTPPQSATTPAPQGAGGAKQPAAGGAKQPALTGGPTAGSPPAPSTTTPQGTAGADQSQVKSNQTVYSQVKANIDKLDKKGKQRILQLLQKSLGTPVAAPAAKPANTMANAPVSASNTAAADNPNQPASTSTGNKVFGQMVNQLSQQNASKINSGNALSETLAQRVELHKQKMFETELAQGTISVFRK
jgi:hypothetical protein